MSHKSTRPVAGNSTASMRRTRFRSNGNAKRTAKSLSVAAAIVSVQGEVQAWRVIGFIGKDVASREKLSSDRDAAWTGVTKLTLVIRRAAHIGVASCPWRTGLRYSLDTCGGLSLGSTDNEVT